MSGTSAQSRAARPGGPGRSAGVANEMAEIGAGTRTYPTSPASLARNSSAASRRLALGTQLARTPHRNTNTGERGEKHDRVWVARSTSACSGARRAELLQSLQLRIRTFVFFTILSHRTQQPWTSSSTRATARARPRSRTSRTRRMSTPRPSAASSGRWTCTSS